MKKLISKVRAAIDAYNMIEKNDQIAVCVSGGKDSVFLLVALNSLKRYYPKKFNIIAITIDPCFDEKETDFSPIENLCETLKITYIIKKSQIAEIIFKIRKESNPCSLCARIRRGMLHDLAKKYNCNKIALGHNLNDAVETFIMNLFNCGKIDCFAPKAYLSRKDIYMIRPLIFCEENKIISAVMRNNLPIIHSNCPVNTKTNRQLTKELLLNLENKYPDLKKKILGSMQRNNISNWKII